MWCVHWYKEHKGKRVLQWTRKHVVIFVAYLTFPRMNHGMFKELSRRTSNFVYIYVLRAKLLPAEQFVGISLRPFLSAYILLPKLFSPYKAYQGNWLSQAHTHYNRQWHNAQWQSSNAGCQRRNGGLWNWQMYDVKQINFYAKYRCMRL